jgi:ABC-type antimicrobial peptide transport system permease subunit
LVTFSAFSVSQSIAIRALARNRLQTILTMSGMAVGVATVLTMVALGSGAQKAIQDQVRAAGMNVILVSAGNYRMKQQWTSDGETEEQKAAYESGTRTPIVETGVWIPIMSRPKFRLIQLGNTNPSLEAEESAPENAAGLGASDKLSLADAAAVAELPGVQYVSAGVEDNARVESGDTGWFTRMHGESATLPKIRRAWGFPHGRFFTKGEVDRSEDVAVIGDIVSQHLFGRDNPVGKTVTMKGRKYSIVGEIASSSWMVPASQGDNQFDAIYVPVTAAQSVMHRSSLDHLTVSTASTGEVTKVSQFITALLRRRHSLSVNQPDDFVVASEAHKSLTKGGMRTDIARAVVGNVGYLDKVTLDQLGKTLDRASRTMTVLLSSVATVSLIVGGIGIMNIMLLSVTERTREIGIRRAVGARSNDVMLQFLMEAIILSLTGGILGILGGVVAARSISSMVQWSTSISPWAVSLSFGISAAVGIVFGYYPAREASRVSPMTSLRYE